MPVNPADRAMTDEELVALFSTVKVMPERIPPAFIYDEGVNQLSIVQIRRELNIFITTVQEQGLAGEPSDFRLLAYAKEHGWTFVAEDDAFRDYIRRRLIQLSLTHAGIIQVHKYHAPERLRDFVVTGCERAIEKETNIFLNQYWQMR